MSASTAGLADLNHFDLNHDLNRDLNHLDFFLITDLKVADPFCRPPQYTKHCMELKILVFGPCLWNLEVTSCVEFK